MANQFFTYWDRLSTDSRDKEKTPSASTFYKIHLRFSVEKNPLMTIGHPITELRRIEDSVRRKPASCCEARDLVSGRAFYFVPGLTMLTTSAAALAASFISSTGVTVSLCLS